jgi:hypothetical protein
MMIQIKTTAYMPEVPKSMDINSSTLGDLLGRLFKDAHFAGEVVDRSTGKLKLEGSFEISLNDKAFDSLPEGLNTSLNDGDTVTIALVLMGGG